MESEAHIGLELLVVLVREVLELGRHGAARTRLCYNAEHRDCRGCMWFRARSTSRGSNADTDLSVQQRKAVPGVEASSIAQRNSKHQFRFRNFIKARISWPRCSLLLAWQASQRLDQCSGHSAATTSAGPAP